MIIIPIKWLFHWEYTLFSDKPICPCFSKFLLVDIAGATTSRKIQTANQCQWCWVVLDLVDFG